MFLPDVTNSRSPTTLAPAVRPTSCLIEPRYSTFGDITASGSAGAACSAAAGTAVASASMEVIRTARRALISSANARRRRILRGRSAGRQTSGQARETALLLSYASSIVAAGSSAIWIREPGVHLGATTATLVAPPAGSPATVAGGCAAPSTDSTVSNEPTSLR